MIDTNKTPTAAELAEAQAAAQARLAKLESELSSLKAQLADPKADVTGLANLYQRLTGEAWVWKARAEALAAAKPASLTADRLREVQRLSTEFEAVQLRQRALKGLRQQANAFMQELGALTDEAQRAESALRREINHVSEGLRREGVSGDDLRKINQHIF